MLNLIKNSSLVLPFRKYLFEKKFSVHRNVNYFRGVFNNFSEAIASAPRTKPSGYDNPDSAKMYKDRAEKIFPTDYPVLFWMEKFKDDISSIFDFGGHFGIHYYSYQQVYDFSRIKRWTVCDVDQVCDEGMKIALLEDDLRIIDFVSNIEACENYDLFLANGSLQYLEWELHDKLKSLARMPKYLIINMTPLHPRVKTITLNNIGTAFCPYNLRKEKDFFLGLQSLGYELLNIWENDTKSCNIAFEPDRSINYYRGAFLKLG